MEDCRLLSWLKEFIRVDHNPESKTGQFHYQWVVVAALFMIGFVGFGFRFSFGVFFKSLQQDFLWSRATTSSVFSVYMGFSAIFTILGGWGLDRYGARKVFALSGFFTGLAFLLTSLVTASWQLFLTYSLFLSLGTAPIYVCSMSMVSRWFSRRRGGGIGYCQLWEQYGYAGYIAALSLPYHPLWLAERLFYPVFGRIFHHDPRRPDTQKTPCTKFT